MEHNFKTPEECKCEEGNCPICIGGLGICKVCGLAEGELTTDCPGEDSRSMGEATYSGNLDYVGGKWVSKPNPTNRILQSQIKKNK